MKKIGTLLIALALTACGDVESKPGNDATNASVNVVPFPNSAQNNQQDNGQSNNDSDSNSITIETDPLEVSPNVIAFEQTELDTPTTASFEVFNSGGAPVSLTAVDLVEDDEVAEFARGGDWEETPYQMAPGETLVYEVVYQPVDTEVDSGRVSLEYTVDETAWTASVELAVPNLAPKIFAQSVVVFPDVPPVTESNRDEFWLIVELQNVGAAPLVIEDVVVLGDDFSVSFPSNEADPPEDDSLTPPTEISVGESAPLRIYFNPTDTNPSSGELLVASNDPENPTYTIELTGNP